mgnify:CR=1 FL=1
MIRFRRHKRRRVPALNTTATADISFMLLVFFLVTTSIDSDKGLNRMLPPMPQEEAQQMMDVSEKNVLRITLDEQDSLRCEGELVTPAALQERIIAFMATVDPDKHMLSIQANRETSYDAYFAMQNAIVAAYRQLRTEYAKKRFGLPLEQLTPEQRDSVTAHYPQRISESNIEY